MPRLLRCPQGHEWESLSGDATEGNSAVCPVCGQLDRTITSSSPIPPTPSPGGLPHPPALEEYEILEEIGRGGMGIVYRARHRERDRLVALKIIRKERLSNPEAVARFRREALAAARLSHPNIVLLFEADQEGDAHYLSMEFVEGTTLQKFIEEHGPLPVDVACDYLRQVALGLQHAHEQGLIHRDIKPSNLMVGPSGVVKILDMGVARLHQLQQEEPLTTLTQHGAVIGTPDYIAPEQVENPHTADIRADLYSLGCTAYFLLTGDVPFRGGSLIQKLDRQRWEVPPSVDQLRPEVPLSVSSVVRRLMAKDPTQRFQAPGELATALEELTRTGQIASLMRRAPLADAIRLTGHAGAVFGVAILSDGQHVVSGGRDRTARTWHLGQQREERRIDLPREAMAVAPLPTGNAVVVATGVGLRLIDALTGEDRQRYTGHLDLVRAVAVSSDGRLLATGSDDRTIRLWDVQTGRSVQRFVRHADAVTGVAFSPDGRLLLSSARDQALYLWDVRGGRFLRDFAVPRGAVTSVAFCSDGLHVVSAHFDTTLRVWDRETGREMRRLLGHRQMVTAVATSSTGRIASGGNDRVLRLWDPESGSETAHAEDHTGPITSIAFSRDGSFLVTGGADGLVCVRKL